MNERVKHAIARKGISIKEVLLVINRAGAGFACLVDENDKFVGIVTDGDIRRAVAGSTSLDSKVESVIPPGQIIVKEGTPLEEIFKLFSDKIKHIPIIDEQDKLVDVISYSYYQNIPATEPLTGEEEIKNILECMKTNWITSGKFVKEFESNFASYCGTAHAVSCCNGTAALHLALLALGIGEGDEVIMPNLSFIATANAASYVRAKAVFVDVDSKTWDIDASKIEEKITPKTKVIMPVHLYGNPCDMDSIIKIAKKHNLHVIEDCAEAHGAEYKNKKVGTFGEIGIFSFYGNKIITTGEGGMCVTNNAELRLKMEMFRNHYMSHYKKYWHTSVGYNYRLTNIQAAIGVAQLKKIDNFIEIKIRNAGRYNEMLSGVKGIQLPFTKPGIKNVYWAYTIIIKKDFPLSRDALIEFLSNKRVDTRPMFYPMADMPMYEGSGKYPVSEELGYNGISLPSGITLNIDTIDYICSLIKSIK